MKLLFWNLYKKKNEKLVAELIIENCIDIAIFSEQENTDFSEVIRILGCEYQQDMVTYDNKIVTLLCRNEIDICFTRPQDRYIIYVLETSGVKYIVAGIHLPSRLHSKAADRLVHINELTNDISEQEHSMRNSNVIVIGDFNASPFDAELVQKNGFNAVLYKELIRRNESVKHGGRYYKRFYNPMLKVFSEENKDYGSYFYDSEIDTIYWYSFDQVIVRKALMDSVSCIKYCKRIGRLDLMSKVKPKKSVSDHLPLVVTIDGGE